jgi:hypothetical protein
VAWFEILAMKTGLRPPDAGLIRSLYARDVAAAEKLESREQLAAAERRFREIEATYEGLHDTSAAATAVERLGTSTELRRQNKNLKRWDAWERDFLEQMNRQFYELRHAEIPPPVAKLARGFRINEIVRRSAEPGLEGVTARRAVNALATGLDFYLARDFTAAGQYDRLALCYELGLMIQRDNPTLWYNLACALTLLGREDAAMDALEQALVRGFDHEELLATDPDLAPLRDRDDFRALIAAR